jgi:HSP20 family protein
MNLWMWRPDASPLGDLERHMSHLLDLTLNMVQRHLFQNAKPLLAITLYEADTEYCLLAPLPGVRAEHLDLQIAGSSLTIKCDRQLDANVPEESYRRQERWQGTWTRTLEMPPRVDVSQITATLENGLLLVRLPKLPQAQPQRLAVQVRGSGAPAAVHPAVVERNGHS